MSIQNKFVFEREEYIDEYQTTAKFWRHKATGAKIAMLENEDTNKVFGISFRTPVADSTGVPHILEHSVLAGSRKYPTKEPFVDLLKGSLYTFLNAFTYPDRTCYPVASQNTKDFYNLIDVYLDAALHPLLDEKTFLQEGWHHELEKPEDPLTLKGVVYNEMRGVYSDPDNTLVDSIMYSLFPETSYRHDSGGNPDNIPELTYEQFKSFHDQYYHPSNAYIYFYGDDHSEARFEKIEEFLSEYEALEIDSRVAKQQPLTGIKPVALEFDPGENDRGGYATKSWLLHEWNPLELSILEDLLLGNSEAPLYKTLIESGLGEDLTPSGFETFGVQPFFMVGLKNVQPEKYSEVITLIDETLEKIATDGFEAERIEASLNSTEFHLRELNTGSQPQGLVIMTEMLKNWIYDRDSLQEVRFARDLEILRGHLREEPEYLSRRLREMLLQNAHSVELTLSPRAGLNDQKNKELERSLTKRKQEMGEDETKKLVETTRDLIAHQSRDDSPEDKAKIPSLAREDLAGKVERVETKITPTKNGELLAHTLPTNGISYVDIAFDIRHLSSEEYAYLPLLQRTLREFDTTEHTNAELTTKLDTHTGNFSASVLNLNNKEGELQSYFVVRGKALSPKLPVWLETVREILTSTVYDRPEKITQYLKEGVTGYESAFLTSGNSLALSHLQAQLSVPGYLNDRMGGVAQFEQLKAWQKADAAEEIATRLEKLMAKILRSPCVLANLSAQADAVEMGTGQLQEFVENFEGGEADTQTHTLPDSPRDTAFVTATKVSYNCLATRLEGVEADKMPVILKYANLDYLWNKIRVIGGAYGTRSGYSRLTQAFTIMSYRDPRTSESYADYQGLGEYLQRPVDDAALLQAITGAIGAFDGYQLPHQKGRSAMLRHITGRTYEELEEMRESILHTTSADFARAGESIGSLNGAIKASVTHDSGAKELGFKTKAV